MKRSALKSCLLVLLVAVPLFAAKFWDTKEFTAWSDQECKELLSKSPWAYSNAFGDLPPMMPAQSSAPNFPDSGGGVQRGSTQPSFGESSNTIMFEFRLLAARPIRMALGRLQLLQKPDDAAVREQVLANVNAPPVKDIVIQISYRTIPPGSASVHDIHSYFIHATLATFNTTTYLDGGKRGNIAITNFLAPGESRSFPVLVFPRLDASGEPIFTGNEKSITLRSEFTPEIRGKKQKYSIFVKMNPKDMRFKDEFAM